MICASVLKCGSMLNDSHMEELKAIGFYVPDANRIKKTKCDTEGIRYDIYLNSPEKHNPEQVLNNICQSAQEQGWMMPDPFDYDVWRELLSMMSEPIPAIQKIENATYEAYISAYPLSAESIADDKPLGVESIFIIITHKEQRGECDAVRL